MEPLSNESIKGFIKDGFIKIENAIPGNICDEAREILWKDLDVDRNDPKTWIKPVIRLAFYNQEPFNKAINMPVLVNAYDQLAGKDKWKPRDSIGTFPVRFPSAENPGDTGWHVDSAFPGNDLADYSTWRFNVYSKGRALLMLFLFSDVGEQDAPTRIKVGSHFDVAKILEPYGEEGLAFMELAGKLEPVLTRPEVLATGNAGTVYLCHPFIVHGAQPHHGSTPRFLAQPALELKKPYLLSGNIETSAPVEKAIQLALQ
jgi:hypothetical protein